MTAPYAALVNATATHGIEMDDRSHNLQIHNGATTVPAAVCALPSTQWPLGRDLILAVVCGYEAAYRVARASQRRIERFYWVSNRNIWGASAAAAKALKLSQGEFVCAFGIAGGMASGLWEFTHDQAGMMSKRLQGGGWPAYSGVTAALLAQRGFTGPASILEGESGFLQSFCTAGEPDTEALVRNLGEDFEMRHWETKAYATRGVFSTPVECVYRLVAEHGVEPRSIRRLALECREGLVQHTTTGRPPSLTAAQYNVPFVVAAAFYYDLQDPSIWDESILQDERVLALSELVEVQPDPQASDEYGPLGSRLTATLADGRTVSVHVRHDKGSPENPMTAHDVHAKFDVLSRHALPRAQADALSLIIDKLDRVDTPLDLSNLAGRSTR